jgi:hypothetical protein
LKELLLRGLLKAVLVAALLVLSWNLLVPSCAAPFGCDASAVATARAADDACPSNLDAAVTDAAWAAARLSAIKDKKKTVGVHYDSDGTAHEFTSGRDGDAEKAQEYLGMKSGRPWVVEHVEVKIAARMRDGGETHGVVVINNEPCEGVMSCPAAVRAILPEGSQLTIWSPGMITEGRSLTILGAAK